MFCENCGMKLSDGQKFCAQCGTPVKARPAQPTYQQPTYQQPVYQQPVYQQPTYQQPVYQNQQMQPDMPMKWFKFLIYFYVFFAFSLARDVRKCYNESSIFHKGEPYAYQLQ